MKTLLFIFLSISFLHANYEIIESENLFIVKTNNTDFETNLTNLRNEINFESFVTIYEINVAKSTNETAFALSKNGVLEKGINLGVCKASFALQMLEENFNNINYCPLGISVYQNSKNEIFISFKKYKALKNGDKIADKINESLKDLIIKSLD
jgi:uncharacterized protein (DUF302 family)